MRDAAASRIDDGAPIEPAGGRFRFDQDLPVFADHFPGRPVLPGIYLLAASHLVVESALGRRVTPTAIDRCKWLAPVLPGEVVAIAIDLDGDRVRGRATVGDAVRCRFVWQYR